MTNGIVASPLPAPPTRYRETERLQKSLSHRAESYDVSYTDASGRSFHLSLRSEQTTYSATYDRTAQVRLGPARNRGVHRELRHELRADLKELREEFKELEKALEDAGIRVKGFKRLLHRMLKGVDREYREQFRHHDPVEQELAATQQVHVEVAIAEQNLTVAMDDVDPEYWSVENTAQRLTDFAVGLYRGGDREDHLEQMVDAMEQGYQEAAATFGGALPEIARDTLDLAREMLQQWAKTEGKAGDDAAWELVA